MTAFARAQSEPGGSDTGLVLAWELKSVNHRFLEAQFRLPEQLRSVEPALRETLRGHVQRGKIDCTLRASRADRDSALSLNRPLLLQVLAVLEQLRRDAPEISAPDPLELLRWPGVLGDEVPLDAAALADPVTDLFEEALAELIDHRHREGAGLRDAVEARLQDIDRLVAEIASLTTGLADQIAQRLRLRVEELGATLEPARLEQEVALLAQRADVAEELDRLRIHVEEARSNLRGPGPHGRRLDFLTQELNREANTLGSKSALAKTSQRAVDLKVVIEQIREQVQNIE